MGSFKYWVLLITAIVHKIKGSVGLFMGILL